MRMQKLHDADVDSSFTSEQISLIQRLGGRASDLESVRLSSLMNARLLTRTSTARPQSTQRADRRRRRRGHRVPRRR